MQPVNRPDVIFNGFFSLIILALETACIVSYTCVVIISWACSCCLFEWACEIVLSTCRNANKIFVKALSKPGTCHSYRDSVSRVFIRIVIKKLEKYKYLYKKIETKTRDNNGAIHDVLNKSVHKINIIWCKSTYDFLKYKKKSNCIQQNINFF
jgi:hypothetical protein